MNAVAVDISEEAPVLFEERPTAGGRRLGIATLNAPRTLNGLSLQMARLLDERLRAWAADPAIAIVILQGAGEKAFCAGGDLQALYRSMLDYRAAGGSDIRDNDYAAHFFETEYRLDYRIHTYPKPVLCWGHGIVMGGGIGLMAGASHRVVTPRSRLAMPEISVGLFPDVGGSALLRRVPDNAGLFLALTGAPLNAADAIYAELADYCIAAEQRDSVFDALSRVEWRGSGDAARLDELLRAHALTPELGPLQTQRAQVREICGHSDLDTIVAALLQVESTDAWWTTAQQTLRAGAPGSARLAYALHQRAADLSLAEVFRLEYIVALHCAAHGDFAEGIRALLIDKDRQPRWQPATLAEADARWAETFFAADWDAAQHPLADLGEITRSGGTA